MRLTLTVILAALMVGVGVPAFAEMQTVEVGGQIRIRSNYFGAGAGQLSFDDNDPKLDFTEQRTLINVKADFTDDVTAFIELDSYNEWGDDFRGAPSDPTLLTGVDNSSGTSVDLYQAYIENREAFGYPVTIRTGRQEIQLGSEWLVGNNDTASLFRGLSFDAINARYDADQFSITAIMARLTENNSSRLENDGDVDFNVLYASYTGLEDMTIDAYWMYARVANTDTIEALLAPLATEAAEIHTFGARFAGVTGAFDWDVEGAFQTGDSGIDGVDQDAFGATGEGGYTFDTDYQPRIFITGSFYSGDDTDAPFNRLFSDHEDSEFLGNTELTNYWAIGGGASAQVSEQIEVSGVVTYFEVDEDFGASDSDLGLELGLYGTYNYSEDLSFEAGYAHFFTGDLVDAATPGDDLNYFYLESGISF